MDAILAVGARHGIAVVEDNAHGLFGRYKGRNLGTFGCLATQSFHETKNITCGEGGALLVNDPRFVERAEIIREKGTNRSRFFRGQVDKYSWVDVGSSYLMSRRAGGVPVRPARSGGETIQAKRRRGVGAYYDAPGRLGSTSRACGRPVMPAALRAGVSHVLPAAAVAGVPAGADRPPEGAGILSVFHYLPLHLSDMGRKFGGRAGDCPVTEDVSDRLLRLPFYNELTEAEQAQVVETMLQI